MDDEPEPRPHDVIIVGGGPAGLSAALLLGRCMRRVAVLDAGHPRNEGAKSFNGFLSRDDSTPSEFLKICRTQLERYEGVKLQRALVIGIERGESIFVATLDTSERIQARMVLLATGLTDVLPEIAGLRELYGKSVHSCPHCHGWECRGQPIGVIGSSQDAAELAIELTLWSANVKLFSNGTGKWNDEATAQLRRRSVLVVGKAIACLERDGDTLKGVRFKDGDFAGRSAIYFSPEQFQRSPLAEQLGCEFCEDDGCIQCGEDAATCIPGVYAAGNASCGVQLVIAAAAEGTTAALAINNALLEEDSQA
jgi:thioredoxin reductase